LSTREHPTLGKFGDTEFDVLLFEFKRISTIPDLARPASPVHTLKDIIAFNAAHKDQELPYFVRKS